MKAEEAREVSNNYHKTYQYDLIQMNIASESSVGKYTTSFLNLTEHTKDLLKADGYKIASNGIGIAGPSYEISWEK